MTKAPLGMLTATIASAVLVVADGAGGTSSGAHASPLPAAGLPNLMGLRVDNGGVAFRGDHTRATTITPNGDGYRDRALFRFRLDQPSLVRLRISRSMPNPATVHEVTRRLGPGAHVLAWVPDGATAPRTYSAELTRLPLPGRARERLLQSPAPQRMVVRVRGVDAAFGKASYRPGERAALSVATDARTVIVQIFQAGPQRAPLANDALTGVPVGEPLEVDWRGGRDAPVRLALRIGDWPSGFYYARLTADDGRVGYAPFVVRPARLGEHRIAVVLPTYTWQAYNFWDQNADGRGDTWYAGWAQRTVRLGRPFLNRGVPPRFRLYDFPFLNWLHWSGKRVDFLAEADLATTTGRTLREAYALVVFPGHHEYMPKRAYDAVARFRDLGGSLMFLSANNFFWHVVQRGAVLERTALWRTLGRPEAALVGVQYRANDHGARRAPFVVRAAPAGQWLFAGTGLSPGESFGLFGIEIDAVAPASPPGLQVVAEIPHLLGRGRSAQMTYYETPQGAKVFAAGALDFAAAARRLPVSRMLENLWARLAPPEPVRTPAATAPVGALRQLAGQKGCVAGPATREVRDGRCTAARSVTRSGPYGLSAAAVSPDGRHVYVGGGYEVSRSTIVAFRRDRRSGALTQLPGRLGCVKHSLAEHACTSGGFLNTPSAIVVTPDARQVLVTSELAGVFLAYRRDPSTGALRFGGCGGARSPCDFGGRAVTGPTAIAVSPDGKSIYVATPRMLHRGLGVFSRNPRSGEIAQLLDEAGCIQRLGNGGEGDLCAKPVLDAFTPRGVVVSPDGRSVYVASSNPDEPGSVLAFSRDPRTGALTPLAGAGACISQSPSDTRCTPGDRLNGVHALVVSPDGLSVYAVGEHVVVFARSPATGALTQLPASACRRANGKPCPAGGVSVSPDGKSVYLTTSLGLWAFSRDPATHRLRQLSAPNGCYVLNGRSCPAGWTGFERAATVSPDGATVYALGARIAVFGRQR